MLHLRCLQAQIDPDDSDLDANNDDELIDDDPQRPGVQRDFQQEQHYDENHPLNDWTRVISVEGKPGTGKTRYLHACISDLLLKDCRVSLSRTILILVLKSFHLCIIYLY